MPKILITGVCGFVGTALAEAFVQTGRKCELLGVDNLIRPGSELNRSRLRKLGIDVIWADVRSATDLENLPNVDWVIDAAANPSVLAGVDGKSSSRQVVEHNLLGTVNLLEYCKARRAGFILLSTSRVYSIRPLAALEMEVHRSAFRPKGETLPPGISAEGVAESFDTAPPVSLYGSTKVASEHLALEYGETFGVPVWINRCGVLAGGGQFGRSDQGIFSYWIHAFRTGRPLSYIGFDGEGHQVRDCLHPRDLLPLLLQQLGNTQADRARVINASGGNGNSISLAQLTAWCADRFRPRQIGRQAEPRPFDIPWLVLDSSLAARDWNWRPQTALGDILEEIAVHAEQNPDWLERVAP